jgi:hypothetical protein
MFIMIYHHPLSWRVSSVLYSDTKENLMAAFQNIGQYGNVVDCVSSTDNAIDMLTLGEYAGNDSSGDTVEKIILCIKESLVKTTEATQEEKLHDLEKERNELLVQNRTLLSLTIRMVDRWWCFVHGSLPSSTARKLLEEAHRAIAGCAELLEVNNLEQQAKGRIDGVAYALNMYCTSMSPKEFPAIGAHYASKLDRKGKEPL